MKSNEYEIIMELLMVQTKMLTQIIVSTIDDEKAGVKWVRAFENIEKEYLASKEGEKNVKGSIQ